MLNFVASVERGVSKMRSGEARALECPQCGAPIGAADRVCSYCKSEIYIKKTSDVDKNIINKYIKAYRKLIDDGHVESIESFMALGICHLKNKSFEKAVDSFEKAVDLLPNDGEPYFYTALSLMHGKRPYLQTFNKIKEIVRLLDAAIEIAPLGKYYYLLYLIQFDFYNKKKLNNHRNAEELKQQAYTCEIDDDEILEINQFVGIQ